MLPVGVTMEILLILQEMVSPFNIFEEFLVQMFILFFVP